MIMIMMKIMMMMITMMTMMLMIMMMFSTMMMWESPLRPWCIPGTLALCDPLETPTVSLIIFVIIIIYDPMETPSVALMVIIIFDYIYDYIINSVIIIVVIIISWSSSPWLTLKKLQIVIVIEILTKIVTTFNGQGDIWSHEEMFKFSQFNSW